MNHIWQDKLYYIIICICDVTHDMKKIIYVHVGFFLECDDLPLFIISVVKVVQLIFVGLHMFNYNMLEWYNTVRDQHIWMFMTICMQITSSMTHTASFKVCPVARPAPYPLFAKGTHHVMFTNACSILKFGLISPAFVIWPYMMLPRKQISVMI